MDEMRHGVEHGVEHGMFVRAYPGASDLPNMLFVHGLGESGLCFERVVCHPALRRWNRWVVDLPGYGRSAWGPVTGLTGLANHLAGWLHTKKNDQGTILIGHSMGGVVALILAEMHPELLTGLVDVDGNKSLEDCSFSKKAVAHTQEEFEAFGFDALRDWVFLQGVQDAAHRGYYASLRLCDPKAFYRHSMDLVAASKTEALAGRLVEVSVPKLYMAGRPDGACVRTISLLEAEKAPWIGIEPSGHWPFVDQPDAFALALADFALRYS